MGTTWPHLRGISAARDDRDPLRVFGQVNLSVLCPPPRWVASCAHPLAGSWVISVQASLLGVQGQGPGIRRKLRDLYHFRSLRRLCIGHCHVWQTMPPERPNFLSVVRSRFLSLVNLRIQPCKPLRIHLANLSSCSLAVIVFYCLDMGLDYIFPPYPMSRAIWQWLTFTFAMQPQICVDRGCSRSIRSSARLFEEARSYSQHEESTNTTLHPESSCDCRFVNESDRGMCSSQGANCVEPVFAERRSRPGP